MMLSRKDCQGSEFKVAKEVVQRRMEVPMIKQVRPMSRGTAVLHKTGTTSRPAMWHGLAMPYGTTLPPSKCWLVGLCHVAQPCPLLHLHDLNFPRGYVSGCSVFFSQTAS